jgi:hypothetical protein
LLSQLDRVERKSGGIFVIETLSLATYYRHGRIGKWTFMDTALIPLQSFYFLVGYGVLVILHDEAWVSRDKWSFGRFLFV